MACPALIPHSSQLTTHAKEENEAAQQTSRKQWRRIGGHEGGSALRIGRTLNPFSAPLFFFSHLLHVPRQDLSEAPDRRRADSGFFGDEQSYIVTFFLL